jgi:CRISPR-associated protein Cst2
MWHLFGNIVTRCGTAANNRGEAERNITTLQKLWWQGETHTTVSAEAIRWALRCYWQNSGYLVNRSWNDDRNDFSFEEANFDAVKFIDDDVLGYMRAEAAKLENFEQRSESTQEPQNRAGRNRKNDATKETKGKSKPKGASLTRRGVLEVTRAVSTTAYLGESTFNALSGKKGRTSLYGTEVHATRYQYGFAMTPDQLKDKSHICAVLDGLASLGEVAGNHSRFLYDFSPESIILRWTHDFSPRFLYCFEEGETNTITIPSLIQQITAEDIDPKELWVGGPVAALLGEWRVHAFPGVKTTIEDLKQTIRHDLKF